MENSLERKVFMEKSLERNNKILNRLTISGSKRKRCFGSKLRSCIIYNSLSLVAKGERALGATAELYYL